MRRVIGWTLLLTLCAGGFSGMAETATPTDLAWYVPQDAAVVSLDEALTTSRSMIVVVCPAEGAVRLRVVGPDGGLVYDAVGTAAGGCFVSESIYLPMQGGNTRYTVSLTDDTGTCSTTVTRTQPYLVEGIHASAGTLPLSAVTGRRSQERILFLRNEDGERRFPLVAGGIYCLGEAVCVVSGGCLTVYAEILPEARAVVREAQVRVVFTADAIVALTRAEGDALTAGFGEPMDLQGHEIAAIWVNLTVSFDPAELENAIQTTDPEQTQLWWELDNGEEPVG